MGYRQSSFTPLTGPGDTEANMNLVIPCRATGFVLPGRYRNPLYTPDGQSRVSHIHTRQSSHCTALSIPDLTRFFGNRCEQEAEQLPPPAACLSVDQLVQLATDAGSPQLTVVRDARKVPE